MQKCDKCNGAGSINTHPYRTAFNKVKDKVVRPTVGFFAKLRFIKMFSMIRRAIKFLAEVLCDWLGAILGFIFEWWGLILFAGCAIAIIYGGTILSNKSQKEHEKEKWVTVQYDDHGQPVRCWVDKWSGSLESDVPTHVSDHYSRHLIINEDDDYGWILEKMGASKDMKCIR